MPGLLWRRPQPPLEAEAAGPPRLPPGSRSPERTLDVCCFLSLAHTEHPTIRMLVRRREGRRRGLECARLPTHARTHPLHPTHPSVPAVPSRRFCARHSKPVLRVVSARLFAPRRAALLAARWPSPPPSCLPLFPVLCCPLCPILSVGCPTPRLPHLVVPAQRAPPQTNRLTIGAAVFPSGPFFPPSRARACMHRSRLLLACFACCPPWRRVASQHIPSPSPASDLGCVLPWRTGSLETTNATHFVGGGMDVGKHTRQQEMQGAPLERPAWKVGGAAPRAGHKARPAGAASAILRSGRSLRRSNRRSWTSVGRQHQVPSA